MSYHTGSIAAVPTANRQQYLDHARECWSLFQRHGATRMVETWGEDVPHGTLTDFHRAVDAQDDETVTFGWITWPDRASADAAWQAMSEDPAMRDMQMPFDGSRMIWGGFATVYEQGDAVGGGYYQGSHWRCQRPTGTRMSTWPARAGRYSARAVRWAWWRPGARTCRTANAPTSIARHRHATTRSSCSPGSTGPIAPPVMRPPG